MAGKIKKETITQKYKERLRQFESHANEILFQKNVEVLKIKEDLENCKKERTNKRYDAVTNWIQSVATINDAIAHALGEGIDNVRR